jgi:hypothetical protein
MPPIMQTLLKVFPEEDGRFVDEPFGSTEQMPDEARPLFETFRVVVPTVDDIEKSLARLFSASSYLKIRKITRYDRDPGAPGLPGFRGVWCQTENKDDVGFSIVTINQNRFLIWAKMGYYPAFGNDSINPKVRDQYARDVSQYLAGVDLKVPENVAPEAGGRGLPEWVDIGSRLFDGDEPRCDLSMDSEIQSWGLRGVCEITLTSDAFSESIKLAPDTLWPNCGLQYLLHDFRLLDTIEWRSGITPLTPETFKLLLGGVYNFAIDRYGRCRLYRWSNSANPYFQLQETREPDSSRPTYIPVELLFPCVSLLSAGNLNIWATGNRSPVIAYASIGNAECYVHCSGDSDRFLESFGHLFRILDGFPGVPWLRGKGIRIAKKMQYP